MLATLRPTPLILSAGMTLPGYGSRRNCGFVALTGSDELNAGLARVVSGS